MALASHVIHWGCHTTQRFGLRAGRGLGKEFCFADSSPVSAASVGMIPGGEIYPGLDRGMDI